MRFEENNHLYSATLTSDQTNIPKWRWIWPKIKWRWLIETKALTPDTGSLCYQTDLNNWDIETRKAYSVWSWEDQREIYFDWDLPLALSHILKWQSWPNPLICAKLEGTEEICPWNSINRREYLPQYSKRSNGRSLVQGYIRDHWHQVTEVWWMVREQHHARTTWHNSKE